MQKQQNIENWVGLHKNLEGFNFPNTAISNSWKRSDNRNIDYGKAMPKELTQTELERTKKSYKRLMICSDWVINHFIANNTESDIRVLLFSKDGILLRIYGIPDENDWLSQSGIKSGTKWSEDNIGTNPFALGIQGRKASDMHGYSNYSRFLIDGSYYFAPVCLTENEIYGSIIIAVPQEKRDQYLLSVAITIARSVELDVFLFQSIDMFTSSEEESGSIFLRQNKGRNEVVIINDQVFKILGIKKPDTYHLTLEEIILPLPENREFWSILE